MIAPARTLPTDEAAAAAIEAAAFVLTLRGRGIRDARVLGAMERVPREMFAPRRFADLSRSDVALPLAWGQTMTAPGTVAAMLVALAARPGERVLEIGTGSGYVTALLAAIGCRVHTIERIEALAEGAAMRLSLTGAAAATMEVGDGLKPRRFSCLFDRILLNGAVPAVPPAVLTHLAPNGRLVGALAMAGWVRLTRYDRGADGSLISAMAGPLRIAPLVCEAPSR